MATIKPAGQVSHELLIPFDARRLGLFGDYIPGTNRVRRKYNAEEAMAATGAFMVLDGSMYEPDSPPTTVPRHRGAQLSYDRKAGIYAPGDWQGGEGGTLIVRNGVAWVVKGKVLPEGVDIAAQGYPALIVDGVEIHHEGHDENITWRAAVGVLHNGQVFFAIARGGMESFAQWMLAQGARGALYTDGGGSGSLLYRGYPRIGDSEDRRVGNWLVAYGGALPPISAPVARPGFDLVLFLGATLFAASVGIVAGFGGARQMLPSSHHRSAGRARGGA